MRKIFAVLIILTATILTACGNFQSTNGKVVVVGIDDDFAPMTFRDESGKLTGFDIDLANEVSKRMGVTFKFQPIDWDAKEDELKSKNVDMIWSGCDITDERKEYMLFSKPYIDDRQILLVKKGNTQDIRSEGDLAGKVVGVQAGATAESFINADEMLKGKLRDLKTYGKFKEAVEALKDGETDVLVCDEIIARYEMNQQPNRFEIISLANVEIVEMGIGFRKDHVELLDEFQKAFDDMVKDGTAQKISEKWFQADLIRFSR